SESSFAGLESAEHGDIDVGSITDLLKGEALLLAEFAKAASDSLVDGLWTRVCLHGKNSCAKRDPPSRSMSCTDIF
ncbi:MAG: hypothetical protein QOE09_2176, partial [Ilumatobacteraceae bacterium]